MPPFEPLTPAMEHSFPLDRCLPLSVFVGLLGICHQTESDRIRINNVMGDCLGPDKHIPQ